MAVTRARRLSGAVLGAWLALSTACVGDDRAGPASDTGATTLSDTGAADPAFACAFPVAPDTLLDTDGALLLSWTFAWDARFDGEQLPDDEGFRAYHRAVRADSADVLRPVADPPVIDSPEMEAVWADEDYNNALVFDGGVGRVAPVRCLEALLFSVQHARYSQLEHPTEFLASVLRREGPDGAEARVLFGAGDEMFPPRPAYGFDVVRTAVQEGWTYEVSLHNHTLQRNGLRLALGVPAPGTSDVGLARGLGAELGLREVRVTNGFYTFRAEIDELAAMRAR